MIFRLSSKKEELNGQLGMLTDEMKVKCEETMWWQYSRNPEAGESLPVLQNTLFISQKIRMQLNSFLGLFEQSGSFLCFCCKKGSSTGDLGGACKLWAQFYVSNSKFVASPTVSRSSCSEGFRGASVAELVPPPRRRTRPWQHAWHGAGGRSRPLVGLYTFRRVLFLSKSRFTNGN